MNWKQIAKTAAGLCFGLGAMLLAASWLLNLEAGDIRDLRSQAISVRAKLVRAELREWFTGNGDWYPRGEFEVQTPGYQGMAEANLTPSEARPRQRTKMPREQAGKFLGDWNIGADYDAFLYADVRDRLFFELPDPGTALTGFMRKSGGVFLLLGIAAYWAASRLKGRVVQPRSTSDWKERGGSSRDE